MDERPPGRLTIDEAAARLGITPSAVLRAMRLGHLVGVRRGFDPIRTSLVSAASVEAAVARQAANRDWKEGAPDDRLTVTLVAAALGVDREHVLRLIIRGRLPGAQVPAALHAPWYVRRGDLIAYARRRKTDATR